MSHVAYMNEPDLCHRSGIASWEQRRLMHTATHCNTLQHTATHCDTLQHTATHCKTSDALFLHAIYMSHVTHIYEWVMSKILQCLMRPTMAGATHINESCHAYEWVMSHAWMSPVTVMNECLVRPKMAGATHINEPCHTYKWMRLVQHISMSHVTHTDECGWCNTYQWVMSHINESCHTYEWKRLVQHISMSHVTYQWVMSHIWMKAAGATHINESCHIFTHMNESGRCNTKKWVMSHI